MEMKAVLTFAYINLRKLVKRRWRTPVGRIMIALPPFFQFFLNPDLHCLRKLGFVHGLNQQANSIYKRHKNFFEICVQNCTPYSLLSDKRINNKRLGLV